MNTYCLFAGDSYYPQGGTADFRGFGTIDELKANYADKFRFWGGSDAWGDIVDHESMQSVLTARGPIWSDSP